MVDQFQIRQKKFAFRRQNSNENVTFFWRLGLKLVCDNCTFLTFEGGIYAKFLWNMTFLIMLDMKWGLKSLTGF